MIRNDELIRGEIAPLAVLSRDVRGKPGSPFYVTMVQFSYNNDIIRWKRWWRKLQIFVCSFRNQAWDSMEATAFPLPFLFLLHCSTVLSDILPCRSLCFWWRVQVFLMLGVNLWLLGCRHWPPTETGSSLCITANRNISCPQWPATGKKVASGLEHGLNRRFRGLSQRLLWDFRGCSSALWPAGGSSGDSESQSDRSGTIDQSRWF